ncbi:histidine phosphatase family protein [Phenylobacterium aquaticum]|uniref:histidine phosphatase family protein n=1 Tax=Phenylobacterium aquaticum TaxID=1763816 RepID=UPI0026EA570D|nr:histidine phosphatase family protein [Phenylobacterium aquaticum]
MIFLTHPEVVIDPAVPVPEWPLSATGRRRMDWFGEAMARRPVTAVWSSDERKALDGAEILSARLNIPHRIDPHLGENGRSSTGYVAPPEFWEIVEAFFSRPDESIRGWETARAAQARIVDAIDHLIGAESTMGDIVVVSHGGVGRLLTAHLQAVEIGREDQPAHPGGGCWIEFERKTRRIVCGWQAIPDLPA